MAVVLLPTPPFWLTMATTVLTAGILSRSSPILFTERPAASWLPSPLSEDTALESPGPSSGLPGSAPFPLPLVAPRPALPRQSSPLRRRWLFGLLRILRLLIWLSWLWPGYRLRAGARNIRQPPTSGRPHGSSRCHKRCVAPASVRCLRPWHLRLPDLPARAVRRRGAGSRPFFGSIR